MSTKVVAGSVTWRPDRRFVISDCSPLGTTESSSGLVAKHQSWASAARLANRRRRNPGHAAVASRKSVLAGRECRLHGRQHAGRAVLPGSMGSVSRVLRSSAPPWSLVAPPRVGRSPASDFTSIVAALEPTRGIVDPGNYRFLPVVPRWLPGLGGSGTRNRRLSPLRPPTPPIAARWLAAVAGDPGLLRYARVKIVVQACGTVMPAAIQPLRSPAALDSAESKTVSSRRPRKDHASQPSPLMVRDSAVYLGCLPVRQFGRSGTPFHRAALR